jgi:hypothetical protein
MRLASSSDVNSWGKSSLAIKLRQPKIRFFHSSLFLVSQASQTSDSCKPSRRWKQLLRSFLATSQTVLMSGWSFHSGRAYFSNS